MKTSYKKYSLCVVAIQFFILSLVGCATYEPLLGTKLPVLAITDAKTALLKANKQEAAVQAPLKMEKAKAALDQAEKLWNRYGRDSGSTGSLKQDDEIREKTLQAMLYAQTAQAISYQKKLEQQVIKTGVDRLKYDSLKKGYQVEEAQIRAIIIKQQKLEAEHRAAEIRAQEEAKAKEEARKYAQLAEEAKLEALKQVELAKQAKQEAQRQRKLAESARLEAVQAKELAEREKGEAVAARQEALRAKELADIAKHEALRAKEQANIAKQEALREKELAEAAQQKAQAEASTAKQQLQGMQKKLTLLSAEFAKVKEEKRGLVVTLSDILFDVDEATIRPGAAKNLKHLSQILGEYPERKILIEGHTDSTGATEHNQILSEERAFAVMGQLMSQGLDPKRINAKGFGETKPLATNDTAEGRQRNRRVDIIILNPEG